MDEIGQGERPWDAPGPAVRPEPGAGPPPGPPPGAATPLRWGPPIPGPYPPGPYPAARSPAWIPPRPLAGYEQRLVACLIDSVVFLPIQLPGVILFFAPMFWLGFRSGGAEPTSDELVRALVASAVGWGLTMVVSLVLGFWYFGWRQGVTGLTIGKRVMRIRLTAMDGRPLGGMGGISRSAVRFLVGMTGVSIVSYLWPLWDAKRQTWEDMVAKSIVVQDGPPR